MQRRVQSTPYSGRKSIFKNNMQEHENHNDKIIPVIYQPAIDSWNHEIWKWEYTCWEKDSPVVFGNKSREEIDKSFRPKLRI
jgi:hypothetical protein